MTNKKYIKEWEYFFQSLPKKLEDINFSDFLLVVKKLFKSKKKKSPLKYSIEDQEWVHDDLGRS